MKLTYYPGCTLKTKAAELDRYARVCAEKLGVTMEESGVSKVITIRLENEGAGGGSTLPDVEPFEEEDVELEENVYIPPHPPKRIKPVVSGDNQNEST